VRLRRIVQSVLRWRRIDDKEMSFRDIVWENAMEAYESSPDPVVDITPYIQARLEAVRHELLLKAHRDKREHDRRRRERRRRVATVAVATVGMLATVAGASAVTGTDVGVDAIDRFLGTFEDDGPDRPAHLKHLRPAVRTPASAPTMSVQVAAAGLPPHSMTSYMSEAHLVCLVEGSRDPAQDLQTRGGGGCSEPDRVFEHVLRDTVMVAGTQMNKDGTLHVTGYTTADVDGVRVRGPFGSMHTVLSEPWNPDPSRTLRIRLFLAADDVDLGPEGLTADLLDRGIDPGAYRIEARLDGAWRALTGGSPRL
jgi:hypothetical protein